MDKDDLENKVRTLTLFFSVDGCTCAHWANLSNDINKREEIFLEPANEFLIDPDTLFHGDNIPIHIKVRGRFYNKKGYPHNYFPPKGDPQPARVFQYKSIKIIKRGK
jgi:hypothetical protein